MSLIDYKKNSSTDVLIKIKNFLINISISLAVYILIFIIGSLTMFACNVISAGYLGWDTEFMCHASGKKNDIFCTTYTKINSIYDIEATNDNDDTTTHYKEIFQVIKDTVTNHDTLPFCVDANTNQNLGIFENCFKYTINFIYSLIKLYVTFLNEYMSEIFILWISPLFSLLFFIFLGVITGAYFYYKLIIISVENIYQKIFHNILSEPWLTKLKQIVISNIIIIGAIILAIFGFLFSPIISFVVVMYAIFNILRQKLQKASDLGSDGYGIFQKMGDNLYYKKGYNIIIILILSIINVFLFDHSIGGIIFALIIIFYIIFYNNLTLQNDSLKHFTPTLPDSVYSPLNML